MTTVTMTSLLEPAPALFPVPPESQLDGEFTPSDALDRLGQAFIGRHELIAGSYRLLYFWKDRGGRSKGRPVLGRATKPTGLLAHFATCDVVIWLAADHLRDATHREVERALFHELSHVGERVPDPEDEDSAGMGPELVLLGHDVDCFLNELAYYGATVADLRPIVAVAHQLTMDLEGER